MEQHETDRQQFAFGDFVLDPTNASLTRSGERVTLAPKEFEVLRALLTRSGHLVPKEYLIRQVWPDTFVSDSSLMRNISVLRRHLGHEAIRTVPKRGYVFELSVRKLESAPASVIYGDSGAVPFLERNGNESQATALLPSENSNPSMDLSSVPGANTPGPPPQEEGKKDRAAARLGIRTHLRAATAAVLLLGVTGYIMSGTRYAERPAASDRIRRDGKLSPYFAGAAWLFVLDEQGDRLSIVNPAADSVQGSVLVSAGPRGGTIIPDRNLLYVTLYESNSVLELDPVSHRVLAKIPVGSRPVGIAANPRPPYIYVANNYSNSVSVIDTRYNRVVRDLAVGSVPTEIAVTADGTRAIVTNQSGGTVSVIDAVANRVLTNVLVGSTPVGIAFTPDSKSAWITLAGENAVAVLDLTRQRVMHRIGVGPGPVRVQITRDGKHALVSNFFSNTLTVVDVASLRAIETISVGRNPAGLAFSPSGELAYVANYGANDISVIDVNTMRAVGTIAVGMHPVEIVPVSCYAVPCDSLAGPDKDWHANSTRPNEDLSTSLLMYP